MANETQYAHDDGRVCKWRTTWWQYADGGLTMPCGRSHPNPEDHKPKRSKRPKEMEPVKVLTFDHMDGRVCQYSSMTGEWYHWEHEGGEPGPKERRQYSCGRQHPGDSSQMRETKPCSCLHPREGFDPDCPQHGEGRGEFGMPTIGGGLYITDDAVSSVNEMKGMEYPVGPKQERVCNIIDEAQTLYKRKAAGYRGVEGDLADHLGVKAQFVDINRKFWRIKAMIWDEVVPMYPDAGAGEDVEEILMDFIGHAALTIDFIRRSNIKEEKHEGTGDREA